MSNDERNFWRIAWGVVGVLGIVVVVLLLTRGHASYMELVAECEARPGGGSTHSADDAFGVALMAWCAIGVLLSPVFIAMRALGLDRE